VSKSNALENSILKLLFNATAIADVAENDTTSPLANVRVSLHTSDPGEGGSQSTNETTYGAYVRVSVARTTTGWVVTNNSVSPGATISFAQATSGTATITHFGVGTATSGAGVLWYKGTVTPNISVSAGVTPQLTTASAITED
jgi:hypothetical protein